MSATSKMLKLKTVLAFLVLAIAIYASKATETSSYLIGRYYRQENCSDTHGYTFVEPTRCSKRTYSGQPKWSKIECNGTDAIVSSYRDAECSDLDYEAPIKVDLSCVYATKRRCGLPTSEDLPKTEPIANFTWIYEAIVTEFTWEPHLIVDRVESVEIRRESFDCFNHIPNEWDWFFRWRCDSATKKLVYRKCGDITCATNCTETLIDEPFVSYTRGDSSTSPGGLPPPGNYSRNAIFTCDPSVIFSSFDATPVQPVPPQHPAPAPKAAAPMRNDAPRSQPSISPRSSSVLTPSTATAMSAFGIASQLFLIGAVIIAQIFIYVV